jgi:hypothetical protein
MKHIKKETAEQSFFPFPSFYPSFFPVLFNLTPAAVTAHTVFTAAGSAAPSIIS